LIFDFGFEGRGGVVSVVGLGDCHSDAISEESAFCHSDAISEESLRLHIAEAQQLICRSRLEVEARSFTSLRCVQDDRQAVIQNRNPVILTRLAKNLRSVILMRIAKNLYACTSLKHSSLFAGAGLRWKRDPSLRSAAFRMTGTLRSG
jgi:hypothetical protein